jgi:hypothetical protein
MGAAVEIFLLLVIIFILLGGGPLVLLGIISFARLIWLVFVGLVSLAVLVFVWSWLGWLGVVGFIVLGMLLNAEEKGVTLYDIEAGLRRFYRRITH